MFVNNGSTLQASLWTPLLLPMHKRRPVPHKTTMPTRQKAIELGHDPQN